MTKEPIRTRAPSCWENRGMPKHRLNTPEQMVPGMGTEQKLQSAIPSRIIKLTKSRNKAITNQTEPRQTNGQNRYSGLHHRRVLDQ